MMNRSVRFWTKFLDRYRNSRLWNINTNIVFADFVSTVGTALIIELVAARLSTPLEIVAVIANVD